MQYFISIGQGQSPRIGQFKAAACGAEQRGAQFIFKLTQLPADGLWREIQLLRCPTDTAKSGDRSEVMKVFVIHENIS